MLRKIQITNEEKIDAIPDSGPDAAAPEFGDHENAFGEVGALEFAVDASGFEGTENTGANTDKAQEAESVEIAALHAELDAVRTKLEDAERRVLYAQADFQNFRRRTEEQNKDLQKFANTELIQSLLPIIDNFERALQAAEQTKNFDSLISGVSGTLRQMQTFLQKAGVTPIESMGQEFDPKFHEAIGHTESSEYPANTVAEEMQRGYKMHDRIIRPALVKVSQG